MIRKFGIDFSVPSENVDVGKAPNLVNPLGTFPTNLADSNIEPASVGRKALSVPGLKCRRLLDLQFATLAILEIM